MNALHINITKGPISMESPKPDKEDVINTIQPIKIDIENDILITIDQGKKTYHILLDDPWKDEKFDRFSFPTIKDRYLEFPSILK